MYMMHEVVYYISDDELVDLCHAFGKSPIGIEDYEIQEMIDEAINYYVFKKSCE